jgi:hypothetical protein
MDETKIEKNASKKKDSKSRKKPVVTNDGIKPTREGRNGGKLKSGNTVNVTGRPPILPDIRMAMAIVLGKEPVPGKTQLDMLMDRLYELAQDGDTRAAQILLDRGYGKAMERVVIEPESKMTNVIEVKFQDP